MEKKLYRDEYHKVIGGVCSGLGEYFETDITVVRLLFAFSFFIMGVGLIPYIILWIVLPKKGYTFNNFNNPYNHSTVDYRVQPDQPGAAFNTAQQDPFTTGGSTNGGNPYGNPYGNNPFTGSATDGNPFAAPLKDKLPKEKSKVGVILGLVLIVIGAAVLVDNANILPDFDMWRLWPAVLVLIGASLIVSGKKKNSAFQQNWHQGAAQPETPATVAPVIENITPTEL